MTSAKDSTLPVGGQNGTSAPSAAGGLAASSVHLWVLGLSGPVLGGLWHLAELGRLTSILLVAAVVGLLLTRVLATRDATVGHRLAKKSVNVMVGVFFELTFIFGALLLGLPELLDSFILFSVVMVVVAGVYIIVPLVTQARFAARPHERSRPWVSPAIYFSSLLAEEALLYGVFSFFADTDDLLLGGSEIGYQILVLIGFPLLAGTFLLLFFTPIANFRSVATGHGSAVTDLVVSVVSLTAFLWVAPGMGVLGLVSGL